MRRPLFWKILIGSWATLLLVSVGNAFVIHLFFNGARPWGEQIVDRVGHFELAIAAQALQFRGSDGLKALAAQLPPGDRLEIIPGRRALPTRRHGDEFRVSQIVPTAAGPSTLVYITPATRFFPPVPNLARLPIALLAVEFVAVSAFSVLIAWYLVGPIERLRAGLERVAEGDLTVRVHAQVAGRRDEMAELGRDFDIMAERLQHVLQARERLMHHVSHEFRSPLTRLLLAVELARRNPAHALTGLDRIEHEAQRLDEMVGELLTLSRAEFAAAPSETYFAVAGLLAAVVADACFEAEAKGVVVRLEPGELAEHAAAAGVIVNGSAELLRKGLDNVLRNAVRVSRAGQTVTVRLATPNAPGARLRIEVADQGPGVPASDLERIFEPFVRLDAQAQGGGFGLGLAIARSAAQAHGGAVRAANRPSGGLAVVFELPVVGAETDVFAGEAV